MADYINTAKTAAGLQNDLSQRSTPRYLRPDLYRARWPACSPSACSATSARVRVAMASVCLEASRQGGRATAVDMWKAKRVVCGDAEQYCNADDTALLQ